MKVIFSKINFYIEQKDENRKDVRPGELDIFDMMDSVENADSGRQQDPNNQK